MAQASDWPTYRDRLFIRRFLVGLELDMGSLRSVGPKAFAICASGIAVPFALSVPITVAIKSLDMSTVGFGYLYL